MIDNLKNIDTLVRPAIAYGKKTKLILDMQTNKLKSKCDITYLITMQSS